MGIYFIENLTTKEIYVGSSRDLHHRKLAHFSTLRNGNHNNCRLQKSYNKYGRENFSFSVIEFVDSVECLVEREQFWLDELKPQFNILSKADNHLVNVTEEVLRRYKRHGEITRGKRKSEEGRKNIVEGRRRYFSDPKNREKHSRILKGVSHKISDGVSRYIYTFVSPSGEEFETRSVRILSETNHLSVNWMHEVANGKRKSNSGWTLKSKQFVGYKKER